MTSLVPAGDWTFDTVNPASYVLRRRDVRVPPVRTSRCRSGKER